MPKLTPQQFVAKWRNVSTNEKQAYQQHFIDLCRLVGHPTPLEEDPTGQNYTFEAGANKLGGGLGWADVWKRGYFAIEYKGPNGNLDKAYQQLLQYRESLENPPLLVVSDLHEIVIHTNFTNSVKRVVRLDPDDLLSPEGMQQLQDLFYNPDAFRAQQTTAQVTEEAAAQFARLAENLTKWGHDAHSIAHFSIRLLFCLFAEDIGLLPKDLFTRLIAAGRRRSGFDAQLRSLFAAMATGGFFGEHEIRHFDGGLFDDDAVLSIDSDAIDIMQKVAGLDWSSIEPSIFGTLFTRSLDPAKRSQLGAQYTSEEDILLIVEPVLMAPLRREWDAVKSKAQDIAAKRDSAKGGARTRAQNELQALIEAFAQKLASTRVLDPACGSGNFLYVSLRLLLDLWKEVAIFAGELGLPLMSPLPGLAPSPEQLYGIEISDYAHELAQATVWIGYLQWLHQNGYGIPSEPILKPLGNIRQMDAILAFDDLGKPVTPEWPAAEVIVGNPPFLGNKRMRAELGDSYVDALHNLYEGRLPGSVELVTYWLEKARDAISRGMTKRAGLIATQAIRGDSSRRVLERIKETGSIFMAWSDRPWILDGAAVRVSMIGFDDGTETSRMLDGKLVNTINADLTATVDLTQASRLVENSDIAFMGDTKQGPFDIDWTIAEGMLNATGNPNGRPNTDVIRPWLNGLDITRRPRNMWIIDFGTAMPEEVAAQYELPFEYVREHVKPFREANQRSWNRDEWWIHYAPRPAMREKLANLKRFICTPRVAKHRVFIWAEGNILPDSRVYVFAREDNYFFGVLHSRIHEVWSLATSSRHGDGGMGGRPTYNNTTCFETFPFPWPPGQEPTDDPNVQAIARAAKELVEKRDAWLNPPGLSESELKKRTLTNLYNLRPTWLDLAHKTLDAAVFDAYGWPHDLNDEEILERLLELNFERAKDR